MSNCELVRNKLESLVELVLAESKQWALLGYIKLIQEECDNCHKNVSDLYDQLDLYTRASKVIDKALDSTLEFQSMVEDVDISSPASLPFCILYFILTAFT